MIDIGANLTHDSFNKDRDEVIAAARAAGVEAFIITGSDASGSNQARDLAHQYQNCFATAGIHPHHATGFNAESETTIEALLQDEKVVAVGETGLDYFRNFSPQEAQVFSFEQHIRLAIEQGLPMFLHQRDAHRDFLPILKQHRDDLSAVVVHCFTDNKQALFDYLDLDCHIGITGWICDERRGKHLLDLVANIPINRLMIETDAPYLLPRDLQPKPKTHRNEPKYLPHIAQTVAGCYQMDYTELVATTANNSRLFFSI